MLFRRGRVADELFLPDSADEVVELDIDPIDKDRTGRRAIVSGREIDEIGCGQTDRLERSTNRDSRSTRIDRGRGPIRG